MKDGNAQMVAMQAKFEETSAKLREDLTARLRVQEASNRTMREKEAAETKKREYEAKLERLRRKGRWAHPSTGKVMAIQLIVEELLLRLWVPCGHVG